MANKFIFNINTVIKSKNNSLNLASINLNVNEEEVEIVDEFKYFEVIVNSIHSLNFHFNYKEYQIYKKPYFLSKTSSLFSCYYVVQFNINILNALLSWIKKL